ncbi:MAG TPA: hypothetical protein VIY28_16025 [Pseudonocardiaceae bacterium]
MQFADADLASEDVEQLSQREQRVRVEIPVCVSGLVRLRPQTGRGRPQRTSAGVVLIKATRILPALGHLHHIATIRTYVRVVCSGAENTLRASLGANLIAAACLVIS